MKNSRYIYWVVLVLSLTSCQQQIIGLFQKGRYVGKGRLVEIPYTLENNLIVIPVSIGNDTYRFMLDTGAPNLISSELAHKHGLKTKRRINTVDSQGNRSELKYTVLPDVRLHTAKFVNTGSAIADLKQADAIACLGIDGLIGSNLLRKAFLQIDTQRKVVRIARSLSDFGTVDLGKVIHFSTEVTGTPYFSIKFDEVTLKRMQLDTGSVGFLSIGNSTYTALKNNQQVLNERKSFGINTVGLFGASKADTTSQIIVPQVQIGEVIIENPILDVKASNQNLMGMSLLENYLVTIDWKKKNLYLQEEVEKLTNFYAESFGLGLMRHDGKMIISYIVEGSDGFKQGLKIGDEVLRINDFDLIDGTLDDYCRILKLVRLKEVDKLYLVTLKDGIKNDFTILKLPILSK